MRLALSSAVLPGRTPADLARACGPRGLAGLEIVLGEIPSLDEARRWRALEVPVIALRAETAELAGSKELASVAGVLEAPVVAAPGLLSSERVAELAREYAAHGATLLLGHRTDVKRTREAAAIVEEVGREALGLAWEIRPLEDDLASAAEVLRAGSPHVLHVRLHGGGPEQRAQDGLGVGTLFVDLALAGYRGAVALAPSSEAQREAWERWIVGTGSSGCGSKAHAAKRGRFELDVRPVEPKDRIETVLGSYDGVGPGGTLHLIVDHDPDCMRHLLLSTQPEGSFSFQYLERGPEVWRVDVVRS